MCHVFPGVESTVWTCRTDYTDRAIQHSGMFHLFDIERCWFEGVLGALRARHAKTPRSLKHSMQPWGITSFVSASVYSLCV